MSAPWLEGMNEDQIAAIQHQDGPARLLAVAGSGKTRVVVHRILRLVREGIDPRRILALTFSTKAADEMDFRIRELGVKDVRVATWHSLCLEILRKDGLGYEEWDKGEPPRRYLKHILGWKGLKWKGSDPNRVADFIARCKARLDSPESDAAALRAEELFGQHAKSALRAFADLNAELAKNKFLSFDDYLVFAVKHLESDDRLITRWERRWHFVVQDEVQDENPAQKRLVHILNRKYENYFAVGDPMQSIFGFREASPNSLVSFEEDWPSAKTYTLPCNYRCGGEIIRAANSLLSFASVKTTNGTVFHPTLLTAARVVEGHVDCMESQDLDSEAETFAMHVAHAHEEGASYSSFCALFRMNAQSRALEEALFRYDVPFTVVGDKMFYERREVKQLLAYLRIAEGRGTYEDVELSIGAPFRFLGKDFIQKLEEVAEEKSEMGCSISQIPWPDVVRVTCLKSKVSYNQQHGAQDWMRIVVDMIRQSSEGVCPADTLAHLVSRTNFVDWLTREEGDDLREVSPGANVHELIRVAQRYDTATAFLDSIENVSRDARTRRNDKGDDRVLLMNCHRAKGLEFDRVWISGFNEGIFPHASADLAEERRLAYVAMTRAKDELVVSYVRELATKNGTRKAEPSRFLAEAGLG